MKQITEWKNVPKDISKYIGFVYIIENTVTGEKYIGKKFFWHTTKKKISGRKTRKTIVKESDWKTYESSSQELKDDIKKYGKDKFNFTILECYESKKRLTYAELREQIKRDVLSAKLPDGKYEYYNYNLLGKFFRKDV